MPNARDAIHGTRFEPGRDDVPDGRLPALHAGWRSRWRCRRARRRRGIPGPLIRARVGDKLRIHFKNLDTLRAPPHSMHFHGVEYEPSLRRRLAAAVSGKGGSVQARPERSRTSCTAGPGSAGVWPYHDHSTSMEESIAGGMYGALSIAGRARAARRPRVRRRVRALARASRRSTGAPSSATRPCFEPASARRSSGTCWRWATSSTRSTCTATSWRTDGGTPEDTRGARARGVVPRALARGRARHLALPLPRRDAHGAGHDRPLPGAPMSRARSPPPLARRRRARGARRRGGRATTISHAGQVLRPARA